MRRVLLFSSFIIISIILSVQHASAQSCVPTNLNNVIRTISCGASCTNLNFQVPHLKSTEDYAITTIPYTPFPYVVATGTEDLTLYNDDIYSGVQTLPFTFCFYDSSYNNVVIGSNGLMTFDETNAADFNTYDVIQPIPYNVGTDYPKAAIMGIYTDLDPRPGPSSTIEASPPDRKIQWRVEGTAPCRKFIVSYYHIGVYNMGMGGPGVCGYDNPTTFQMVIYESTGLIDVYIQQKACNSSTSSGGRTILGIQNWNRDKAVAAPGKNSTIWNESNTAYRFTPNGTTSKFVSSELLDMSGTVLALADTSTTTAGLLDISFPNICPAANNTQYVVRTTFGSCPTGTNMISLDTITVIRNTSLPTTTVTTTTTCGNNTGTATVTVTPGNGTAPFSYSIDGGPVGSSNVFTGLASGSHIVFATDATGCDTTYTINIGTSSSLPVTVTSTQSTCPGANNGTITITPGGGVAPYTFVVNGPGGPYTQSTGVFTGLAGGAYTFTYTDSQGCSGTGSVTITTGSNISGTSTSNPTSCSGSSTGSITATGSGGVGPYTYSLNGGPSQTSGTFTGLAVGSYTITIVDSRGCTVNIIRAVTAGLSISITTNIVNATCPGAPNGSVTINPTNGSAPYTYTVNGGPSQTSNVFTGLVAGTYTFVVTDAGGCTGTVTRTVGSGTGLTGGFSSTSTSCPNVADGTITVTPSSGAAPYTYALDGGPAQSSSTLTGVSAGTHTVVYTDAVGCTGTFSVTINSGPGLTGTSTSTLTSCPTVNNGTITVTPSGNGPYTFTLNPGNITQSSATFTNLAPGTYTITFTTASGCGGTVSPNPVVGSGPALTSSTTVNQQSLCANSHTGSVTINPGGTGPYSFTITPGTTQTSPTFTGLAAGTYAYSFTDAPGCSGSGSFTITTNPALTATVTKVMPLCNGNTNGSITIAAGGGVSSYQYAISPFTTFQPSGTFGGLAAGTYTFRIKDNVGCTKDTTVTLAQPAAFTASATNSKVATCNGNDGTITVTVNGGTAAYQYSLGNAAAYQSSNILVAPDTGAYPAIKVKDANGCIANTSAVVALNDTMRLSLGADQTICVESSITLVPQTNPGTSIFTWTSPDAPLTTLNNPAIQNPKATPFDTSTYILNAQWGVCKRADTILINVLHKPIPNAGLDTAICNQATQTIPAVATLNGSATNLSGTVNYSWAPAAKVDFPDQQVTTAHTNSTQNFVLTVTDNYGCNFAETDTVTVFVQPPVIAFAGKDTIAMLNRPHQLTATGGTSYLWSPAAELNDPTLQSPLATLSNDTRFIVLVRDIAGCEGMDTVFVKVYEGPTYYIPNAFSPNNDGRNDIFRPIPSGMKTTEYFRVFNRFGELIFETNQWLKGWDGTYRGKAQPQGTYVWMVKGRDESGKVIEQKGTVVLLR